MLIFPSSRGLLLVSGVLVDLFSQPLLIASPELNGNPTLPAYQSSNPVVLSWWRTHFYHSMSHFSQPGCCSGCCFHWPKFRVWLRALLNKPVTSYKRCYFISWSLTATTNAKAAQDMDPINFGSFTLFTSVTACLQPPCIVQPSTAASCISISWYSASRWCLVTSNSFLNSSWRFCVCCSTTAIISFSYLHDVSVTFSSNSISLDLITLMSFIISSWIVLLFLIPLWPVFILPLM